MSTKPLPIPTLEETFERAVTAVSAVADEVSLARTQDAVASFTRGQGAHLQQELESFAEREQKEGRSWLSADWLDSYFTVREPLQLSTNVEFQLNGEALQGEGVVRAAEFLSRAVTVHLAQAQGRTEPETDFRGNQMDMGQWACFAGGVREPKAEKDQFTPASVQGRREVGVFYRGRLYAVAVTSQDGIILSSQRLQQALEEIVSYEAESAEVPFAAVSSLGSGVLGVGLLGELLSAGTNAQTYRRLTDLLLTLTLVPEAQENTEHLRTLAFEPGHAWVYKPLSYSVGLQDSWLGVHVEHSTVDGATLVTAIKRMQEVELSSAEVAEEEATITELSWNMPAELTQKIAQQVVAYSDLAAEYTVCTVLEPWLLAEELPFKMSADALLQICMATAQHLTFGTVRAAYEAVDMREFQAGRTECIRPVTPENVALAQALANGTATEEQLYAALQAHRGWVKACKSGKGFDRHVLGLQLAADRLGELFALADDAGLQVARTDFLSTTSVGAPTQVVRYVFAPTVANGFGISYAPFPDELAFCVTYRASCAEKPQEFLANLSRSVQLLREFVCSLRA